MPFNYREWYLKNKEQKKEYLREYYLKNKEQIIKRAKKRYLINKEQIIKQQGKYKRNKYHAHFNYRLETCLRGRVGVALRRKKINITSKATSTMKLVGCTIEELWRHLEKNLKPGMTKENYGYRTWHIDHIIPCFSFDLSDPEQQKKCFHYTNLQPLWAVENIRKGNKIILGDITSPKT